MKKLVTNLIAIIVTLNVIITDAYARAGGGHSGGGGRGHSAGGRTYSSGHASDFKFIITIIIILVFLAYLVYRITFESIKNIKSKKISKVNSSDLVCFLSKGNVTDEFEFSSRVKKVYLKVQRSWSDRNLRLMEGYVSESLFENHKNKINDMIKNNKINVLKEVRLDSCRILRISKDKDIDKAFVEVRIHGSMIDYWVDENKKDAKRPNKNKKSFSERWTFVIRNNKWVLHKISQM